jgi:hypothetical protein
LNKVYFPGLNGLRFFAAIAVVITHVEMTKKYLSHGEGLWIKVDKIVGSAFSSILSGEIKWFSHHFFIARREKIFWYNCHQKILRQKNIADMAVVFSDFSAGIFCSSLYPMVSDRYPGELHDEPLQGQPDLLSAVHSKSGFCHL